MIRKALLETIHEAAHMLACRLRKVAVFDVCFFRFGNPAGYVIHEPTENFTSVFLIAVGPFLLNSLLCRLFCFRALVPVQIFDHVDALSEHVGLVVHDESPAVDHEAGGTQALDGSEEVTQPARLGDRVRDVLGSLSASCQEYAVGRGIHRPKFGMGFQKKPV